MTAKVYKNILQKNLSKAKRELNLPDDFVLLHDNALIHTAKIIRNYLSYKDIETMPHPPSSPDLNPIENVWNVIENQIRLKTMNTMEDVKRRFLRLGKIWTSTSLGNALHPSQRGLKQSKRQRVVPLSIKSSIILELH